MQSSEELEAPSLLMESAGKQEVNAARKNAKNLLYINGDTATKQRGLRDRPMPMRATGAAGSNHSLCSNAQLPTHMGWTIMDADHVPRVACPLAMPTAHSTCAVVLCV